MVDVYLKGNDIDLNNSFTVGDKESDILFGENINTSTILIVPNLKCSFVNESKNHHSVQNLLIASEIIENY